jgi:hypothetical protein
MALLVTSCSTSEEPAVSITTTAGVDNPPVATTTSTVDPAELVVPEPADFAGIWAEDFDGILLQFRLDAGSDGAMTGLFDSVSEGVNDLPITVTITDEVIVVEIEAAQAVFEGTLEENTLSGIWMQGGAEVPMVFERQTEPVTLNRPQEPQPPFPYKATEVVFDNDGIALAGTLIIPDGSGPFPAAILVSGSGSQDRDESLLGHKPFLVLADSLARQGIATLRYDDRGVGGSTGDPLGATTADLATDAKAAVDFLRDQPNIEAIGLAGHSEGGLIGPMVALDSADVEFLVLLAGPGLPGADVLLTQTEELMRAEGAPEAIVEWRLDWNDDVIAIAASDMATVDAAAEMRDRLTEAAADAPASMESLVTDAGIEEIVTAFTDPWMRFFLAYDPAPALEQLAIPVLAMIGSLDLQVSAAENIPALEEALAGNDDATTMTLPGLNHLFQNASTGAFSEYAVIDETFDPATMQAVADWILERF